jgi:hypothetical protein
MAPWARGRVECSLVAQDKMLAGLNLRHLDLDNFRPPAAPYGPETKKPDGVVYMVMCLGLSNGGYIDVLAQAQGLG